METIEQIKERIRPKSKYKDREQHESNVDDAIFELLCEGFMPGDFTEHELRGRAQIIMDQATERGGYKGRHLPE